MKGNLNMKTKEELNELKKEYENVKSKLSELSEDELKEVAGGVDPSVIETYTNWEILPTIQ